MMFDREDVRGLNTPWQSLRYTLGWKFVINDGQSFSWVYYLAVQNPLEFSKGICSYEDNISWRFTECDVLPLLYLFFCWENLYGLDGVGRNKSQSFCHNLFGRIRPHLVDGNVQKGVGVGGVPSMTHKVWACVLRVVNTVRIIQVRVLFRFSSIIIFLFVKIIYMHKAG